MASERHKDIQIVLASTEGLRSVKNLFFVEPKHNPNLRSVLENLRIVKNIEKLDITLYKIDIRGVELFPSQFIFLQLHSKLTILRIDLHLMCSRKRLRSLVTKVTKSVPFIRSLKEVSLSFGVYGMFFVINESILKVEKYKIGLLDLFGVIAFVNSRIDCKTLEYSELTLSTNTKKTKIKIRLMFLSHVYKQKYWHEFKSTPLFSNILSPEIESLKTILTK